MKKSKLIAEKTNHVKKAEYCYKVSLQEVQISEQDRDSKL